MNSPYLEVVHLLPQIHRQFMEVIKTDLERLTVRDINNVQTIILFKIGDSELSIGDLTSHGVYIGSNVSYNVKKLVENGYLTQEHTPYDRRVSWVRLTEKGRRLRDELIQMHQRRVDRLSQIAPRDDELHAATLVLDLLDRFWTDIADRTRRAR